MSSNRSEKKFIVFKSRAIGISEMLCQKKYPGPTQPWNTQKNARILTLAGIIGVLIIITACIIFR